MHLFFEPAGLCGIGVFDVYWVASNKRQEAPRSPSRPLPSPAAATAAAIAPKGIFQRDARSLFHSDG